KQAPWQVTNNYLEDRKSLKNAHKKRSLSGGDES
ncbi:hypothetical protein J471_5018, partial [Acinetobacter baumannii 1032359]